MMSKFEKLESRDLLAADIQVVHDLVASAEVGTDVTQTIRVFADESSDVAIRSVLTSKFENPSWRRFDGYGNKLGPLYDPADADFAILGAKFHREIGDFNGDGLNDSLFLRSNFEFIVVYGGLGEGLNFESLDFDQRLIGPTIRVGPDTRTQTQPKLEMNPIGDINGDGFEDLSHFLIDNDQSFVSIIFGGDTLGNEVIHVTSSPSAHTAVIADASELIGIGDLNGDGYHDAVVGQLQHQHYLNYFHSDPSYLLLGHTDLNRGVSVTFEQLGSSDHTTLSLGSVRQADSVGDFNHDGFDDAVLVSYGDGIPVVLYGGTEPSQRLPLSGYNSIGAGLYTEGGYVIEAYHYAGSGDVDGDGIPDIAFSFNGGDCDCGASGRPNVQGGVVVIHGGKGTEPGAVFRPITADNTNIRIDGVSGFMDLRVEVRDLDGDQLSDLHVVARGVWPDAIRNVIVRGSADLDDIDFGHLDDLSFNFEWNGRRRFDGETVYGFTDQLEFVDLNADGISDVLNGTQVSLGEDRRSVASGSGDITETVSIGANRSVIYEVTGTLRSAMKISTTAIADDFQDENLRNNIQSDQEGVLLHFDVSPPRIAGNQVELEFQIRNSGPMDAKNVAIVESLSQSLDNVQWEKVGSPFPAVISLDHFEPGIGTELGGPESTLFWSIEGGLSRNQIERYFGGPLRSNLGIEVGSLGDRNADGIDDVFVAWFEHGSNSYLQFKGSTNFANEGFPDGDTIPRPQQEMVAGDFNGDGLDDSVFVRPDAGEKGWGEVHVVFGTVDGGQPNPREIDGVNGFRVVGNSNGWANQSEGVFGDINGDGFDDFMLTYWNQSYEGEVVVIYGGSATRAAVLNVSDVKGGIGFRIEPSASNGFGFGEVTIASDFDINGDGIDDLLIGDLGAGSVTSGGGPPMFGAAYMILGQTVAPSQGTGSIQETLDVPVGSEVRYTIRGTIASNPYPAGVARITVGAGQIDLHTSVHEVDIGAVPNSIELTDSLQRLGNEASGDGDFADLDGDGDLDLFVAVDGAPNQVWFNNGEGTFFDSKQSLGGGRHTYAALGDVDDDGDIDAIVARLDASNELWMNDGSGVFSPSHERLGDAVAASVDVALADLDGDNDLDLFIANTSSTPNEVYFNDGAGNFGKSGTPLGTVSSKSVELVDLDGDGDVDAVVANQATSSRVWINDGRGRFRGSSIATSGEHIATGDLDADGDPDLIVAGPAANEIWMNDGRARFTKAAQELIDGLSSHVVLADLDADGDLDVLVANWRDEANRIWVNDGVGHFADSGLLLDFGLLSERLAVGDIDGDGDLDVHVAVRNHPSRIYINDVPPLPGDINRSGNVDFTDFLTLSKNFGQKTAKRVDGDLNQDEKVDFADFLILSANFGKRN